MCFCIRGSNLDQIGYKGYNVSSVRFSGIDELPCAWMCAQAAMINYSDSPYARTATWRPSSLGAEKKRQMFYSLAYASLLPVLYGTHSCQRPVAGRSRTRGAKLATVQNYNLSLLSRLTFSIDSQKWGLKGWINHIKISGLERRDTCSENNKHSHFTLSFGFSISLTWLNLTYIISQFPLPLRHLLFCYH